MVLGGFTPCGILLCSPITYLLADIQAIFSCVSLFSHLKYGPHRYRIPVSIFMLGMHPSVFTDMFS